VQKKKEFTPSDGGGAKEKGGREAVHAGLETELKGDHCKTAANRRALK